MSDQPLPARQEYNEDEMRALLAQHNNKIIDYWNDPANEPENVDRVRGAVESVLGTLDGNFPGMPAYRVTLIPEQVDMEEGSYVPGMKDFPEMDMGGDLLSDLETYNNPNHPLANFRKEFNALRG